MPEWHSVDITTQMAEFMKHTPWYSYPYWNSIKQYWVLFNQERKIVRQKCGFVSAYCSSYTIMDTVVGSITTLMLGSLGVMAFIPRQIFTSSLMKTPEFTKMSIYNKNNINLKEIDDRIQILCTNDEYNVISVPRYIPCGEIIKKIIKQ